MKFNFKSSGIPMEDRKFKVQDPNSLKINIGIKTPLQFGNEDEELFKMHFSPIEQVKDNLKNLVLTNHGERLGRFNLGANLNSVLFDRGSASNSEYMQNIFNLIENAVNKHIPLIQIDDIEVSPTSKNQSDLSSLTTLLVKIKFSIPKLRIDNQNVEVAVSAGG
tara:strand:- start:11 stop:502 length:492 start_codon:yes stop_codon:yes gene_type:complete